jgi:hypothetical protein
MRWVQAHMQGKHRRKWQELPPWLQTKFTNAPIDIVVQYWITSSHCFSLVGVSDTNVKRRSRVRGVWGKVHMLRGRGIKRPTLGVAAQALWLVEKQR